MKTCNLFQQISLLGISALMVIGCTGNFDDWNTNPHEANSKQLGMDNLYTGTYFVQMQKNNFVIEQLSGGGGVGAETYQIIQNLTGDSFAGYT